MSESICIVDFCGYTSPSHFPISFWADWQPDTKLITFGGDWYGLPPVYYADTPMDDDIDVLDEQLTEYAAWYFAE